MNLRNGDSPSLRPVWKQGDVAFDFQITQLHDYQIRSITQFNSPTGVWYWTRLLAFKVPVFCTRFRRSPVSLWMELTTPFSESPMAGMAAMAADVKPCL